MAIKAKVARSARGVIVDFDKLARQAANPGKRELKTREVKEKVKEVQERRVRGFIPAPPPEPIHEEAAVVVVRGTPRKKLELQRKSEHSIDTE